MSESLSDVVFVIEGKKFPALKQILVFKSKVFRAMFSGNFKESGAEEVVIEDTTFEAFKTLIRFIYCEQLVLSNKKDLKLIRDVCELADRYQVFGIFDKMGEQFSISIRFDNLQQICDIAFGFKINGMIEKVKELLVTNFTIIITKDIPKFKQINDSTRNTLLEVIYCHMKTTRQSILTTKASEIVQCNYCYLFKPN